MTFLFSAKRLFQLLPLIAFVADSHRCIFAVVASSGSTVCSPCLRVTILPNRGRRLSQDDRILPLSSSQNFPFHSGIFCRTRPSILRTDISCASEDVFLL